MNKLSNFIAVAIASTACFAEAPQQLSATIDTWIEGTVISLDADGQKFAVRGAKLPYASAEAEMIKDIADDTKDLEASQRQAKIDSIKLKWQDKLNKTKTEQLANPSDFNFVLPDKAGLVIFDDKQLMRDGASQESLNQKISVQSSASGQASASVSTEQSRLADSQTVTAKADSFDSKELSALRTLKDLKIGEKVKVGFDAGLISNTAYVIVNDQAQALR